MNLDPATADQFRQTLATVAAVPVTPSARMAGPTGTATAG